MSAFLSGPTPPYNNPPIEPQFYKPKRFVISDVTLGQTTIVTTVLDMDYDIGQQVRLLIPSSYGCYQLNEVTGFVINILADNQVEMDIDSSQNVDTFFSGSIDPTKPEILAIGDINTGAINNHGNKWTHRSIPGSFKNISPL
jgi:hypothetical protein